MNHEVKVNLNDLDDVTCAEGDCDSVIFTPLVRVKRVPGIQIGQPEDQPHMLQLLVCSECGMPYEAAWAKAIEPKSGLSPLILK